MPTARSWLVAMLMMIQAASPCLAQQAVQPAAPAPAAVLPPPTVDQVLSFYHTEEYLDQSLAKLEEALKRRRKEVTFTEQRQAEILSTAARIYRKKNLYTVFRQAYARVITAEQMTSLWQWMNEPLGQRLKIAYDAVYLMTAKKRQAAFNKVAGALQPNRKNVLATLVASAEQDELYATLQQGSDLGVYLALNAYQPKGGRDSVKYLKEKIKARKSGYLEPGRAAYLACNYVLLKDFKNEDVDEISKFSSSATGQAASRAWTRALELTLESAGATLAAELAKKAGG